MWWAEEFGNGRHIRVKFKRTDDVKKGGRKLAVFEKMGGRGNLALKKGDSVRN